MTATGAVSQPSAPAAQRSECVACGRCYGRLRVPVNQNDDSDGGLWSCAELVVCDQCWHLAGGSSGVEARMDAAGEALEPVLVLDPAVEALLMGAADYDLLHPLDRLLVESGIRWAVLRHIVVPARVTLAGWVLRSAPPDLTCRAESARLWLDEVEARIRAQSGPSGGFTYTSRKRRWWRIAHQLACATAWQQRPLTWMAQPDIAAAVGCSTRTVRRVVAWLKSEGLLWEVVPGCRLPQQHVPDDETPDEAAARRRAMAAAISAEQAAIARAHAELDAVRAGHRGAAAAATAAQAATQLTFDRDNYIADLAGMPPVEDLLDPALVNLAPVYELRLPAAAQQVSLPTETNPVSSTNTDPADHAQQFGRPPSVCNQGDKKSSSVQPVDRKRRAPRGSDEKEGSAGGRTPVAGDTRDEAEPSTGAPGSVSADRSLPAPQSEAVRAAQWLLRSRLDPNVCDGVSVSSLAALIRGAHLLDRHGWTWEDLADLLHGAPEYPHLPRYIHTPRAWIRARFAGATPTLPPSKLRIVLDIERGSDLIRQRRQAEQRDANRADIDARRTAIDACSYCDQNGWIELGPHAPTARCTHEHETQGW